MFVHVVLPLLVVGLVLIAAAWLLPRASAGREVREVGVLRRSRAAYRAGGLVTGLLGAYAVQEAADLGRGLLLAGPVLGLGVVAGVLLGETAVRPRPRGNRSASLAVRRVVDFVPPALSVAVGTQTLTLLGVMVVTTVAGSADDLGRSGRVLSYACSALEQWSSSPWPGSFYTVPLASVLALGLAAAAFTLRVVVLRPTSASAAGHVTAGRDDLDLAVDQQTRRRAAEVVVAACGLLVSVPAVGLGLTMAAILLRRECMPAWWSTAGHAALGWALMSLVLLAWCLLALLPRPVRGVSPRHVGAAR